MYKNGVALALAGGLASTILGAGTIVLDQPSSQYLATTIEHASDTVDVTMYDSASDTQGVSSEGDVYDPTDAYSVLTDAIHAEATNETQSDTMAETTYSTAPTVGEDSLHIEPVSTDTHSAGYDISATESFHPDTEFYITCPFPVAEGRILIDFTVGGTHSVQDLVVEANSTQQAAQRRISTTVPAGTYELRLASFYPEASVNSFERQQQWYLELYGDKDEVVAQSTKTRDINDDEQLVTELVPTLNLPTSIVTTIARHGAYPDGGAHPVAPLCVALDRVPNLTGTDGEVVGELVNVVSEPVVVSESTHVSCPLPPRSNRTIVDFTKAGANKVDDLGIRANGTQYDARRGPTSTYIPEGLYEVRYASQSAGAETSTKDHEEWFVILYDAEGSIQVEVPPARDIPDWDTTYVSKVDTPISIDRVVTRVDGVHHMYPHSSSYLFVPLCVSFDRVGGPDEQGDTKNDAFLPVTDTTEADLPLNVTRTMERVPTALEQEPYEVSLTPVPEPATIGLETTTRDIVAPGGIITARQAVVEEMGDVPFDVLRTSSQKGREDLVQRLFSYHPTAVHGTTVPPLPSNTLARTSREGEHTPSDAPTGDENWNIVSSDGMISTQQDNTFTERRGIIRLRDTDGDGISDYDEENIYGTNPDDPFTGRSILSDGERVLLGLDPRTNDTEPVVVESPRVTGKEVPWLFTVDTVEFAGEASTSASRSSETSVRLAGTAEPLSFVTLYIYSTPVIITVRADAAGRYEYTVDQTLEDGTHEVFVASVDNSGRILAKSAAVPFVKTAEAIEFVPLTATADPVENSMQIMLLSGFGLVLLLASAGIVWIGMLRSRRDTFDKVSEQHEET